MKLKRFDTRYARAMVRRFFRSQYDRERELHARFAIRERYLAGERAPTVVMYGAFERFRFKTPRLP